MLKNYIKIAVRNLRNNPGYSLINIGGLTVGIVCCLFIFQYVAFESSFDDFNEKASTLYRVTQSTIKDGDPAPMTGYGFGPALQHEIPEVVRFTRLHPEYDNAIVTNPLKADKTFEEEKVFYADSSFLQMFTYPLVAGDSQHALTEPGTVLLSQTAARKYFGEKNPMGKTLEVAGWVDGSYQVVGIFKDVPQNSHLQFDILLPTADLLQRSYNNPQDAWNWLNFITYVQIRDNAQPKVVEQKFSDLLRTHMAEAFEDPDISARVEIQPLLDIHLNKDIQIPHTVMGSYRAVYFFTVIGLVTLLIALVNYINFTTARALNRAQEVGVRKAIGARKSQLAIQFLCEFALTIFAASLLALFLGDLLMPVVNNLAGTHITTVTWMSPDFWLIFLGMFCLTTFLAGLYPAFILSSFKSTEVLKGKTATSSSGGLWLRRGLVVFQFTAAIVLLAGTAIVYSQLNYMRNMDLGINLDQIITVPTPRVLPQGTDRAMAVETFKQELNRLPAVRQIATSSSVPGKEYGFQTVVPSVSDPSKQITAAGSHIDTSFASLYGLELIAGNGFRDQSISTEEDDVRLIIATETALEAIGFDTPQEAIGKEALSGRIIGVFKDFNWTSAHEQRANAFFVLSQGGSYISLKVHTEQLAQTIASIKKTYQQLFPGNPFQYAFVDEQFDRQYHNDEQFAEIFTVFAGLAITIACLGLFGLATYTAEQRTKEIGIRKVLGASVMNIVSLISKDFIMLVLIGFFIAVPAAWYLMGQWLQNFAYRVNIGPGIFVIAGGAALLIALATVSYQSIKAALMNPVNSLRSE